MTCSSNIYKLYNHPLDGCKPALTKCKTCIFQITKKVNGRVKNIKRVKGS